MVQAGRPQTTHCEQRRDDYLIRRNRALLTQAAASRAYAALLRDEAAETALQAYAAPLSPGDVLRGGGNNGR